MINTASYVYKTYIFAVTGVINQARTCNIIKQGYLKLNSL